MSDKVAVVAVAMFDVVLWSHNLLVLWQGLMQ
jgi:hypothetical protein